MTRGTARRWAEGAATILAVLSLWPWILGWPHPAWRVLLFVMLGVMAALFALNVVRLWRLGHPKREDED